MKVKFEHSVAVGLCRHFSIIYLMSFVRCSLHRFVFSCISNVLPHNQPFFYDSHAVCMCVCFGRLLRVHFFLPFFSSTSTRNAWCFFCSFRKSYGRCRRRSTTFFLSILFGMKHKVAAILALPTTFFGSATDFIGRRYLFFGIECCFCRCCCCHQNRWAKN